MFRIRSAKRTIRMMFVGCGVKHLGHLPLPLSSLCPLVVVVLAHTLFHCGYVVVSRSSEVVQIGCWG